MPKRKNKQSQPAPSVQPEQQNKSKGKFRRVLDRLKPATKVEKLEKELINLKKSRDEQLLDIIVHPKKMAETEAELITVSAKLLVELQNQNNKQKEKLSKTFNELTFTDRKINFSTKPNMLAGLKKEVVDLLDKVQKIEGKILVIEGKKTLHNQFYMSFLRDFSSTTNSPETTQDIVNPISTNLDVTATTNVPTTQQPIVTSITSPSIVNENEPETEDLYLKFTVPEDFVAIPVIVRANDHEVKALAIYEHRSNSSEVRLTNKLFEELELTNTNNDVTISSFDDLQTMSSKAGTNFRTHEIDRLDYKDTTSRLWPHLFGENQLPLHKDVVQVELDINMANALRCSALTSTAIHQTKTCSACIASLDGRYEDHKEKLNEPRLNERIGTSNPKEDKYWRLDKATFNIARVCPDRKKEIIDAHNKSIENRAQFVKSGKDKRIAEGNYDDGDPWYKKILKCLFPYCFKYNFGE